MTALVIAEHDNQSLKAATLNAVAAALQCSPEVDVLVAGSSADAAAAAAAQIAGVRKVIQIDAANLADQLAEPLAAQILSIAMATVISSLLQLLMVRMYCHALLLS